jgi:hypothetical protein
MHILISHARFLLAGSETYSVTIAEQLEKLGHAVTIFAGHASPEGRELAASRGLKLETADLASLADRDDFDAAIAQDAASAYAAAGRREVPQIFVMHGFAEFEHPPRAVRPLPPVVVLNDRVRRHADALAGKPEVVRLRQPIDLQRFKPRGASRPRPRRVLVFSNYLERDRLAIIESACEELGLDLTSMGINSETSVTPQERIADADIVVGYGRSVLEAMVMGRAAYVWDRAGGDGWVTTETYPALEASGFNGGATDAVIDSDRLREDFAAYTPELGTLGHDIVRNHHSAAVHVEELVRLLDRTEAPSPDPVHESLGVLVRAEARQADNANRIEHQLRLKAGDLEALRLQHENVEAELERTASLLGPERERRIELEAQIAEMVGSSSWRLTAPLRRLTERLRTLRGR